MSTSRPELSPTPTTLGADSLVGIAITHCFVSRKVAWLWLVRLTTKGDERRRELDHHVPRQDHDVGATAVSGGQEDGGTRLEKAVYLGLWKILHGHDILPSRFCHRAFALT